MLVCEPLVVDAEQMENGRLEVTDVDRVFDDVVREIITRLAGEPLAE